MSAGRPWAVVTGAGSGLGRELALCFARAGYGLALAGRRLDPLSETLAAAGGQGEVHSLDVTDAAALGEWSRDLVGRIGAPSVLIPAAGQAWVGPVENTDARRFEALVAVNLHAVVETIRLFLPAMRLAGSGLIVGILSSAAKQGFPEWTAYCASKWGLAGYFAALREELRGSGVRILEVFPGATATPIWDGLAGDWDRNSMMRADEVAQAIVAASQSRESVATEQLHLSPLGGAL